MRIIACRNVCRSIFVVGFVGEIAEFGDNADVANAVKDDDGKVC
jgi:hypothetical protein